MISLMTESSPITSKTRRPPPLPISLLRSMIFSKSWSGLTPSSIAASILSCRGDLELYSVRARDQIK
ncbi:hypothetical protein RGCCGE502_34371 (plasmid) [Rhizobium grahamii CCGE 502]|uniref:Uncharacterized protein n=1 Tax=Rhizobium grahamii CCGE 502 TaxID=990285 RepID=S3I2H8_9HYPH|nr:hypothetical protein RGCCGE502_34371 [Rhizobium grahamii CCGE 502]